MENCKLAVRLGQLQGGFPFLWSDSDFPSFLWSVVVSDFILLDIGYNQLGPGQTLTVTKLKTRPVQFCTQF